MKKAVYINRTPARKNLVNIIMEPWPEKGLSDSEVEEQARELRLWMGEYLPGTVFDKVFEREGLEESPGRIDIPIKREENLVEIHKGNFSASILVPAPLPVKDEDGKTVTLRDNPGPLRLRLEIPKIPEGEGSSIDDRIRKIVRKMVSVRSAANDPKDLYMLDKYINELAEIFEEGERGSS